MYRAYCGRIVVEETLERWKASEGSNLLSINNALASLEPCCRWAHLNDNSIEGTSDPKTTEVENENTRVEASVTRSANGTTPTDKCMEALVATLGVALLVTLVSQDKR